MDGEMRFGRSLNQPYRIEPPKTMSQTNFNKFRRQFLSSLMCLILGVVFTGCGNTDFGEVFTFFSISGKKLVAIASKGSRHSEIGAYVLAGTNWISLNAPIRTCAMVGNEDAWYALTSENTLFSSLDGGVTWNPWPLSPPFPWQINDIKITPAGNVFICGARRVCEHNKDGKLIQQWDAPSVEPEGSSRNFFVRMIFFTIDGSRLLVAASSGENFTINTTTNQITVWNKGLAPRDPSIFGADKAMVLQNETYLMCWDGLFHLDGSTDTLQPVVAYDPSQDFMFRNLQRDMIPLSSNSLSWLLARNSGIDLMTGTNLHSQVWRDDFRKKDYGLINNMVSVNNHVYASFIRTKGGFVGLEFTENGKSATVLRFSK